MMPYFVFYAARSVGARTRGQAAPRLEWRISSFARRTIRATT